MATFALVWDFATAERNRACADRNVAAPRLLLTSIVYLPLVFVLLVADNV